MKDVVKAKVLMYPYLPLCGVATAQVLQQFPTHPIDPAPFPHAQLQHGFLINDCNTSTTLIPGDLLSKN